MISKEIIEIQFEEVEFYYIKIGVGVRGGEMF